MSKLLTVGHHLIHALATTTTQTVRACLNSPSINVECRISAERASINKSGRTKVYNFSTVILDFCLHTLENPGGYFGV